MNAPDFGACNGFKISTQKLLFADRLLVASVEKGGHQCPHLMNTSWLKMLCENTFIPCTAKGCCPHTSTFGSISGSGNSQMPQSKNIHIVCRNWGDQMYPKLELQQVQKVKHQCTIRQIPGNCSWAKIIFKPKQLA